MKGFCPSRKQWGWELTAVSILLAAYCSRLALIWLQQEFPTYFFTDSTSHVLISWLQATGRTAWGIDYLRIETLLRKYLWLLWPDIFYGPVVLNISLTFSSLIFLYIGSRVLLGRASALFALGLAISLPSFSRLALSGQPEPTYIFFLTLAFLGWCLNSRAPATFRLGIEVFILCSLGMASDARSEGLGFLIIYTAFLIYRWRARRMHLGLLLCVAGFWFLLRYPHVSAHAIGAIADNSQIGMSFTERCLKIPRWALTELFPFNILFLISLFHFLKREWRFSTWWIYPMVMMEGFLLWVGSWYHLMSIEMERNLCAVLFLLIPFMADAWMWLTKCWNHKAYHITMTLVLVAALGYSWRTSTLSSPLLPDRIQHNRRVGRQLRALSTNGVLRLNRSSLLLEPTSADWPNLFVYSGLPDRILLATDKNIGWGNHLVSQGDETAWGMLVKSNAAKDRITEMYGPNFLVAEFGEYKLYKFIFAKEPGLR